MSTQSETPKVFIETSMGNITLELFTDKAPITVANFLNYVDSNFYENTIFHRVIPDFMIQGGGFLSGMEEKETEPPIKNEATNGLSNIRGSIAMARTQIVDSASSQFFINLVDNHYLDHQNSSPGGFGYCVFGKVVQGMDVVDKIAQVPTRTVHYFQDVPVTDIVIKSIRKVES